MSTKVLGVGELGVVRGRDASIKTYALGSCVAIVLMDPTTRSVGMAHIALPSSATNPRRARSNPGYFADTGVQSLFEAMLEGGMPRGASNLIVKLVGGARVIDVGTSFDIGKRNALAVRKSLWGKGLAARSEDLGGTISRTVEVICDSGKTIVSTSRRDPWEI